MLRWTSSGDATAPRIASRSRYGPGAGEHAAPTRIVDIMEAGLPDIDPERLVELPLEDRAVALEDLERRLRSFMDDDAAQG
jgi:hypothetical protein